MLWRYFFFRIFKREYTKFQLFLVFFFVSFMIFPFSVLKMLVIFSMELCRHILLLFFILYNVIFYWRLLWHVYALFFFFFSHLYKNNNLFLYSNCLHNVYVFYTNIRNACVCGIWLLFRFKFLRSGIIAPLLFNAQNIWIYV